jgi:hypothetical protein
VLAGFIAWAAADDPFGRASLSPRSAYYVYYGRVASFADCSRFTPPPRSARLCPHLPRDQRQGMQWWVFDPASPLVRSFGHGYLQDDPGDEPEIVRSFVKEAILAQPLDYLEVVGRDLVRIVDPDFPATKLGNDYAGYTPDNFAGALFDAPTAQLTAPIVEQLYSTELGAHEGDVGWLGDYERNTRMTGIPMLIAILLALGSPLLARRGSRGAATLCIGLAAGTVVPAIMVAANEWRYIVPVLGPLWAAAALGAAGAMARIGQRRDGRTGR